MSIHIPDPRERDDSTNEPIDRARLDAVLRGSDQSAPAFLAEIRRSVDADVEHLLDACRLGDLARVAQLAHRIEGACKVIGARPMGEACSIVAQAVRSGEPGELRTGIDVFLERKQALYACLNQLHPAASVAEAGSESDKVCAGLVFLVVEDHEFQRGLIMRLLRQLGALEVHGYADGASALAAARKVRSPAIMVLDLELPVLGGLDLIQIAAQERLPVSVIINSALGEALLQRPLQTALSFGATVLGAVSKPLSAARLAPLLAQYRHDQLQGVHLRYAAHDVGTMQ